MIICVMIQKVAGTQNTDNSDLFLVQGVNII